MSQRKILQFSTGALLLLLPWFGGLVLGEISNNFSQCHRFFYNDTPPQGITGEDYQPICQFYKEQYRFATLYYRSHRSALYSAYIVSSQGRNRPADTWMYEPQLETENSTPEMLRCPAFQAVLEDYKGSIYTKGHLTPVQHQQTVEDREATYTLTNVVPQQEGSNSGPWKTLEEKVSQRYSDYCNGTMYVITGVIPSGRRLNNKVSVPEYMWSAYCCPSYKSNLPESERPFFPTYAAVGRNDPNSGEDIVRKGPQSQGYDVREMPLNELEGILRARLNMQISLFDKPCK